MTYMKAERRAEFKTFHRTKIFVIEKKILKTRKSVTK